jgi:16S rRNA (cytosine967-C5)-methyltransferase
MNVRALAAQTLDQVLSEGRSLSAALPPALAQTAPQDRGLLQELCYGACRWQPQLQAVLNRLLQRPLPSDQRPVPALLLIGLYQLWHLRIPDHAAVAETVAAVRVLRKPRLAGLVNAVLRNALRRREELTAVIATDPEAQTAHPRWLLDRLQQDWPDDWPVIIAANNARPSFTLRVNRLQLDRKDYRQRLAALGKPSKPSALSETALTLADLVDPATLPGFAEGWVSVQDAAAQLAAPLLEVQPGMRVLDACAAPGGKTGHLLESVPDIDLTALDQDADRLARVRDNLQRLRLKARLIVGDARRPSDWWDGVLYDRILLDAPCSGTGVIRRHPDIKLLRRAGDLTALTEQQRVLLESLWPLLKPGGRLVYATCSVLQQENAAVIAHFLATHADAAELPIAAAWGRALAYGRQLLPGADDADGFYYAILSKPLAGGQGASCSPR